MSIADEIIVHPHRVTATGQTYRAMFTTETEIKSSPDLSIDGNAEAARKKLLDEIYGEVRQLHIDTVQEHLMHLYSLDVYTQEQCDTRLEVAIRKIDKLLGLR